MDSSRRQSTTALLAAAAAAGCLLLVGCAGTAKRAAVTVPLKATAVPKPAAASTVAPASTAVAVVTAPEHAPSAPQPATSAPQPAPSAPQPAPSAPQPAPVTVATTAQPVSAVTVPHFGTPEAAMRYLVAAYNAHDIVAERHVTTPDSRDSLEGERQWVNTFRFDHCDSIGGGQYQCQFDMVSKVATSATGTDAFGNDLQAMGEITVTVAPADRPGWYMAANLGCGDALVNVPAN